MLSMCYPLPSSRAPTPPNIPAHATPSHTTLAKAPETKLSGGASFTTPSQHPRTLVLLQALGHDTHLGNVVHQLAVRQVHALGGGAGLGSGDYLGEKGGGKRPCGTPRDAQAAGCRGHTGAAQQAGAPSPPAHPRVEHVQPAVGHRRHGGVALLQRVALEELVEHLALRACISGGAGRGTSEGAC